MASEFFSKQVGTGQKHTTKEASSPQVSRKENRPQSCPRQGNRSRVPRKKAMGNSCYQQKDSKRDMAFMKKPIKPRAFTHPSGKPQALHEAEKGRNPCENLAEEHTEAFLSIAFRWRYLWSRRKIRVYFQSPGPKPHGFSAPRAASFILPFIYGNSMFFSVVFLVFSTSIPSPSHRRKQFFSRIS